MTNLSTSTFKNVGDCSPNPHKDRRPWLQRFRRILIQRLCIHELQGTIQMLYYYYIS